MDKIILTGGTMLQGKVSIQGAKNAVLPVLAATLLTAGKNEIENVPRVRDVSTMVQLISELGGHLDLHKKNKIILDTSKVDQYEAPYDLVSTMRASCLVLGPLISRLGRAKVSLPGGCAIGARPIDLHIKALQSMGAEFKLEEGYVHGAAKKLKGARFYFDTVTVTGTANLIMAAVLAEGVTVLENAAKEPEVVFLSRVLNDSGAKIDGAGTDIITIRGVGSLKPLRCRILPDRIETGTYMIAGAITGGEVEVVHCIPEQVEPLIQKLRQAGVNVETGESLIRVAGNGRLRGVDIKTQPFPGFPTDLQAQFMALMSLAKGQSVISENVFENRFMHTAELKRMGADIKVDGHIAIVTGVKQLSGAPVMATDLRASASLVLAGLAARGQTVISRVYHIDRGYETMEKKLSRMGADIKRIK